MSKMDELAQLFAAWKEEYSIPATNFYSDGIINEALFDSCKPGHKVLMVAKEPNASNHDQTGDRSFITEWDSKSANYPFAARIGEWAYGIFHDFPAYDIAKIHAREYLRHIAFMNVKKMGGHGLAVRNDIYKIVKLHRSYIAKQLAIIQPDIVVLGLSFDKALIKELFDQPDWKRSGYGIDVARIKQFKLINFYHPSARNVPAASYSLLQNVIRSAVFGGL